MFSCFKCSPKTIFRPFGSIGITTEVNVKLPKKVSRKTISNEFKKYLEKLPILKQTPESSKFTWSKDYIRIKRGSQTVLTLVEEPIAEKIISLVRSHHLDPKATVIEFNPGFGVLTSHLINGLGFRHITCFESDGLLGTQLVENFKVKLIPLGFLTLPRIHHADKLDGNTRVSDILSKLDLGNSKLYIFGATGTNSFINFCIRSIVTQRALFEEDFPWEGMSFYIALGSKPSTIITSAPESLFTLYRPGSILFQLLFLHEVLGTLPRKAFLPWESIDPAYELPDSPAKYRKIRIQHNPVEMHLLHFRPNMDVINKVGRDKLVHLWYFIRHNLHSRKNPLIPQFEQWIPGSGPRLIRQGFTIFTQFGSLTPQQILDLYYQFASWPEYPSSSFLTAVEKFQSKLELAEEDILDSPKPI